jgi:hypothetical protein
MRKFYVQKFGRLKTILYICLNQLKQTQWKSF